MLEAKGLDPKPVEIDGFTKSEITQQKEACPDEGYGHHRAHQRAVKQGLIIRQKEKSPATVRKQWRGPGATIRESRKVAFSAYQKAAGQKY